MVISNNSMKQPIVTGGISSPTSNPAASPAPTASNPNFPVATTVISNYTHMPPLDSVAIDKVAFSSGYKPSKQINAVLWQHVRANFGGGDSVWNWLGDNMYADTDNANTKRVAYNEAREDAYYREFGPVAEPKIPTTGTWDDHDYGWNNMGRYYDCRMETQNEFVHYFNVPESDPRHPSSANQQQGIYSANIFQKSGGNCEVGIHLINVDTRFHRSSTYSGFGPCEGSNSTMLGGAQWGWLEAELSKDSKVNIIGSGIQVLPPTHQSDDVTDFCAHDGPTGSFVEANAALNEGPTVSGTSYESWAEIPQERTKLLHFCQESINSGHTKQIIFLSGDQHWAEIDYGQGSTSPP